MDVDASQRRCHDEAVSLDFSVARNALRYRRRRGRVLRLARQQLSMHGGDPWEFG